MSDRDEGLEYADSLAANVLRYSGSRPDSEARQVAHTVGPLVAEVRALRAQVASLTAERDQERHLREGAEEAMAEAVAERDALQARWDARRSLREDMDGDAATLKAVREAVAAMDEPIPAEPTHYMTRGLTAEPRPEFVAWERRTQAAQRRLRELLAPAPEQPGGGTP